MLSFISHFFINDTYCYSALVSQAYISPTILLYTHIPTAIVSLIVGFYIFFKNPKNIAAKIFLLLTAAFFLFAAGDLGEWFAFLGRGEVLFVRTIIEFLDPVLFALSLYFLYVLIRKQDLKLLSKMLWSLPLVPVVVIIALGKNIIAYDWLSCDVVENQLLTNYVFYVDLFYLLSLLFFAVWSIIKNKTDRKETVIASVGVSTFAVLFFAMEYVFTGYIFGGAFDYSYFVYAFLGMPVLILFLGYLIVKYKEFNIKLVGSFALVFALAALNFSLIFISDINSFRLIIVLTFLLTIPLAIFLIRSILRDIKRDELLEQLAKARGEFLSIASHQLRTPVSLILGTLSLMRDGTFDQAPEDQKKILWEGIFVKANKLNNIIDDILQATEMDVLNFDLAPQSIKPVDAHEMVGKICHDLKEKADEKKIDLTFEQQQDSAPLLVSGNARYLEHAFSNIIDNAIKYTQKGFVKVSLTSHPTEQGKILFKVQDSGIGVPPEEQSKLFGKFSRAKNAVNSYADGSGLGLFIVKKIVDAHPGGKIWFESPGENKGTTFFIELNKAV